MLQTREMRNEVRCTRKLIFCQYGNYVLCFTIYFEFVCGFRLPEMGLAHLQQMFFFLIYFNIESVKTPL